MIRKLPMYVRMARLRDKLIDNARSKRDSDKYPNCLGTYTECEDLKEGDKISDCKGCPHDYPYTKKKQGGDKMSEEIVEKTEDAGPSKAEKKAAKLEAWKAKGWEGLTAGEKATVRRQVNKGEIEFDIPEKKKKVVKEEAPEETPAEEKKEE